MDRLPNGQGIFRYRIQLEYLQDCIFMYSLYPISRKDSIINKMKSTKNLHTFLYSAILLLCMAATSCSDEKLAYPDYTISGEDVKVSFSLTFPSMEKMTRSNLPDADLNRVNNIWVRTYSSETKEATSKWEKKEDLNKTTTEFKDEEITIQTKSGYSYIVAVANVKENKGVLKDNPTAEPQPLSSLLENANSWEDFMNIAVVSPSDFDRTLSPSVPLPMSGCYIPGLAPGGSHPDNLGQFGSYNFKPVFIPAPSAGSNTTNVAIPGDGAIHLRRLVSHLTFKFSPAEDLDLDVTSYKLVNIPKFSWLYERPDKETLNTNFGDLAATPESIGTYYSNNIQEFTGQYIVKDTDGSSSFDFWQSENKHTGTSTTYAERGKYTTSGNDMLFTSLTGESWSSNNLASYVLVSCSIKYKAQIKVDDDGALKKENEVGENVYRTGFATYLIHLGYISGNGLTEEDKSKDFNCYRNVDYTYNIKVNGVNDIRLDAYAQGDFPNQEGIVVDQGTKLIELDAHYGAFNIRLTEDELRNKNFGFIIETFFGADYYKFTETSDLTEINENLYNWIELRAAPGPTTLAYYRSRFGENTNPDDTDSRVQGKKTFLLTDLKSKEPTNRGPFEDMQSDWISPDGWYTVFVNEYTYEQIYQPDNNNYGDETYDAYDTWMHYVNRNPRRFFITTKKQEAPDGKTIYARSRCGVEQMSIQTYYSSLTPTKEETYTENNITYTIKAGTAVGVERVNETEGLNMRDNYGGGSDPNNGRWNVAQYLSGQPRSETDLNINNPGRRTDWKTYIQQTKLMTRGAVTGDRAQNGPDLPARGDDNPIYIPALTMLTDQTAAFNDPQDSSEAIEAINACTSRNRDNNGNGIIDPEELRWYVPAIGKYLRLILGRNSLGETPLMKYTSINNLPKVTINGNYTTGSWNPNGKIDNGAYTRYFFAGSNNFSGNKLQVVWGMEGMSTSAWGEWSGSPWQVRCLRNLGTDLRSVSKGHKVSMAYRMREGTTDIVEMAYYDASSVRKYKLAGNGDGSGQMPIHINTNNQYNMAYKAFQFKTDVNDDIQVENANLTTTPDFIKSNPCSKYGNEWRVPNQFELAIMRNLGIFPAESDSWRYWTSCTALYFNSNTGIGSPEYKSENQELFGVNKDKGVRLSENNYNYAAAYSYRGIWIRCVRDVD